MIDTEEYENMTWETPSDELEDAVENLLTEVIRLRKENEMLLEETLRISELYRKTNLDLDRLIRWQVMARAATNVAYEGDE